MKLSHKQEEAQALLAGPTTHILLYGGARSGKTDLILHAIITRALKAPGSRHIVLRFRFNRVKTAIAMDSFPRMLAREFPGVLAPINRTDWFAQFGNGSEIWFGGLDEGERTEKLLGHEYSSIYLNECSEIGWGSANVALTRLAQLVQQDYMGIEKAPLKPRMYYDCNPPNKNHWVFKVFMQHTDPETRKPLPNHSDYAYAKLNPIDNVENLAEGFISALESQGGRYRSRFLLGEFADATPGALFNLESIDKWRVVNEPAPDMVRIVVSVDPSGADDVDNAGNDEIGIVVCGLGIDGNGYLMEDCSVKAGPSTWGRVATTAYDRHEANLIVGEKNYGGARVKHVIQTSRARTPYKDVTATRGKHIRAEPISALYEQGRIRHVGYLSQLEDELSAFTASGYVGGRSPNRADALIWGMTELFSGIVAPKRHMPRPDIVPYSPLDRALGL